MKKKLIVDGFVVKTKSKYLENEINELKEIYPKPSDRTEFLYNNLGIIDSKASSLLACNVIGLTFLSVWLGSIPLNWLHFLLDIVFVVFLISSLFCIRTIWLFWAPLSGYKDDELTKYLVTRKYVRTKYYHISWLLTCIAFFVILLISVVHMIGTFLMATNMCGTVCKTIFSIDNLGTTF